VPLLIAPRTNRRIGQPEVLPDFLRTGSLVIAYGQIMRNGSLGSVLIGHDHFLPFFLRLPLTERSLPAVRS
jgi:hypothetical protein